VECGRVAELFVSPGSSVGFIAEREDAPKVKISENRRVVGLRGAVRGLKTWPADEGQVVAVALDRTNGLRGLALAHANLPISEPVAAVDEAPVDEPEQSPERSPTARKPYMSLTAPGGHIDNLVTGGRLTVTGRRFPEGAAVEVLVDGDVVEKTTVRADGTFTVTLVAPPTLGVHTLTVRDAATKRVIDGSQFKVNRGEARKGGAEPGRPAAKGTREQHGEHEEDERAGERVTIRPPTRGR
jgi:hypothetical protein